MFARRLISNVVLCKRFLKICPSKNLNFKRCYAEQASSNNGQNLTNSNLIDSFNQPKRINRRKRPLTAAYPTSNDHLHGLAYSLALAESFDLNSIFMDETMNYKYQITLVDDVVDAAIHLTPRNTITKNTEISEFFIFSDGVIVFWNVDSSEQNQIVDYLMKFAEDLYSTRMAYEEAEKMPFKFVEKGRTGVKHDTLILLNPDKHEPIPEKKDHELESFPVLERYTISHAMACSAKISVWEVLLNEQAEPLSEITKALTNGKILWRRRETLQKTGEFAGLRHSLHLTELLNKDFYWDRPELEKLYNNMCRYFTVNHRLATMSNKLDYCEKLVNVIDNTLAVRHSSTLEWMIIVLIVIEVVIDFFDVFHFYRNEPKPVYIVSNMEEPEILNRKI